MTRLARAAARGDLHHVTQRGNRRQRTFFCEADCARYVRLTADSCARCATAAWPCFPIPNHVHPVMVPRDADGPRCALAAAHRRHTRTINPRENWRGHLWQGRSHACVMDEGHLSAAVR
jgi:putative transposase